MGLIDLLRARPRGVRPELPAAAPGASIWPAPAQWGEIPLPLASTATVLGLPAASRARNMIANAVATMAPMQLWTSDGYISDTTPNVLARPNTVWGCFDFFFMAVAEVIMRGNFLGIQADFDGDGYAQQVIPVPAGFWYAYYDEAGYLVYSISGLDKPLSRDEVVHVRANATPNQPMGVGVVTQFRRAIGAALDQQNFSADTYRSGSVPAGVINLDLPEVDAKQAAATQAQWLTNHSGGRAPAVLPKTMTFTPLAWNPEDAQFLESRAFTVGEIAHMFNMDPTDLGATLAGAGASMTYANIEQREQARISDTYGPMMRRFEDEWSDLVPGKGTAKLNPANLLRTDTKTRAEVDQLELANLTTTPDEARKARGKRPLPPPPKPVAPPALLGPDGKPAAPAAPGAPAPPGTDAGETGDVLAKNPAGVPQPTGIAGDPNIAITPVKVKV